MPFEVTDKDLRCRKLLASSDVNECFQGVRLFYERAVEERATLIPMVASRMRVSRIEAEAVVADLIGEVAFRLLRDIEERKPSLLDDRHEHESVVMPVLGFCKNKAFESKRQQIRDERQVALDEKLVEAYLAAEEQSDRTNEFAAEFLKGMCVILQKSDVRRHKRGVFALEATKVPIDLGFSREGIHARLVRVGLEDEVPIVLSRVPSANIASTENKLSHEQMALLFQVDPARVRQWMKAVIEWIVKQSPLLQDGFACGELGGRRRRPFRAKTPA